MIQQFAINNLKRFATSRPFTSKAQNGIVYSGLRLRENQVIFNMYTYLNSGEPISLVRKILYIFQGNKMILVAHEKHRAVGINVYYVNNRDLVEGTVHEGFIGVLEEFRGKGLATAMRKFSANHFAENGFTGISTRISVDNSASLKSAENSGFKLVDSYFDPAENKSRYYMKKVFIN